MAKKIVSEKNISNCTTWYRFSDGTTGLIYAPVPKELLEEPMPICEKQWNSLKDWIKERIKNANKCLNDPNENWDEDANGYVLARKFMLEETLKHMGELEKDGSGKDI